MIEELEKYIRLKIKESEDYSPESPDPIANEQLRMFNVGYKMALNNIILKIEDLKDEQSNTDAPRGSS